MGSGGEPLKGRADPTWTFTSEFRQEFEADTERLLRKRELWLAGVVGGFALFWLAVDVVGALKALAWGAGLSWGAEEWIRQIARLVTIAFFGWCFSYVRRAKLDRARLSLMAIWMVVVHGTGAMATAYLPVGGGSGGAIGAFFFIMFVHLLASVLLPWTASQAVKPIVPLLLLNAGAVLFLWPTSVESKVLAMLLSPLAGVPGVIVCWLRHSRRSEAFKMRFLQRRYGEMRQELVNARQIHESLFPSPRTTERLSFEYVYEPMRQIGGDYLHAAWHGEGCMSLAVLDVTGHGIPAALTVNRLHGELERLFAEQPGIRPGEVLHALNRYVHLTLANHSIYMTAFCARIDVDRGVLEYASGGHPPAFVITADGRIEELESTALVLGASPAEAFEAMPREVAFGAGDCLVAYTDGVTEARDPNGKMLGLRGLRAIVAGLKESAEPRSTRLIRLVDAHRGGPTRDDVLVIEVRGLVKAEAAGGRPRVRRAVSP